MGNFAKNEHHFRVESNNMLTLQKKVVLPMRQKLSKAFQVFTRIFMLAVDLQCQGQTLADHSNTLDTFGRREVDLWQALDDHLNIALLIKTWLLNHFENPNHLYQNSNKGFWQLFHFQSHTHKWIKLQTFVKQNEDRTLLIQLSFDAVLETWTNPQNSLFKNYQQTLEHSGQN